MLLEQLLGQTSFVNERQKAMVGVLYVANLITKQQTRLFEDAGLSPQKYNVLRILRGQYPTAANERLLRERIIDKTCDMPRLLQWLAKAGLIARLRNEHDKRVIDVAITEKGLVTLAAIDKKQDELSLPVSLLTEHDAKQMNEQLEKMLDALVE